MSVGNNIILFDGVCNLCNSAVQFVIRHDTKNIFKFASLQSETGKSLLVKLALPTDDLRSFVLIRNGKVYTRSGAALRVSAGLKFPYNLLSVLLIVPKFLRDFVYDIIARNRYKLFGKKDACMVPKPELRARFLN